MIEFISTALKNFKSFGNVSTKFNFDSPGMNMIVGNNTDSPSSSNGAGKSTIQEGLVYSIYGKSTDGLKDNELINNINNKDMIVETLFKKDNVYYKVIRYRKTSDGNGVKLFSSTTINFDDTKELSLDSIANTNAKIIDIIGISYELFIRVACFSANNTPFFELSPRAGNANQSVIIEELFELLELAEQSDILKAQTKENEIDLRVEQAKVEQIEQEIDRVETQKITAKDRIESWEATKLSNIEKYAKILDNITIIDFDSEIEHHIKHDKLISDAEYVNVKMSTVKRDISDNVRNKTTLDKELESLHDSKCPYCDQHYQNADKIAEIVSSMKSVNSAIELKKDEITKILAEKDRLLSDALLIKDTLVYDNINLARTIKQHLSTYNEKLKELNETINPYIITLEELDEIDLAKLDYVQLNELKINIEHQKFLYKLLTNKNSFIRKTLLNKHIPYLNTRLYEYLNEMDLPHKVQFGHDLSAQISKFGKRLEFGNLSNGQKARVNFALALAFRDILQQIYGKINICILDEVLDFGLDSSGIDAAAKVLKQKANSENISIFVISHRNEMDSVFDKIYTIELKNNFSSIK